MTRPLRTVRDDMMGALARLSEAVNRLPEAWHRLSDQQPGFRSNTDSANSDAPERSLGDDQARRDLDSLDREARRAFSSAIVLYDLCTRYGVTIRASVPLDDDDWCSSCRRDNGYCEPAADAHYKGLCRWCGDWKAAHDRFPPTEVLEARHRGERISTAFVQRILAQQRTSSKKKRKAS